MTRYAVTGASGWLGRAALEVLAARGDLGSVDAYASTPRTLALSTGDRITLRQLAELAERPADVLLHYAYVTREFAGDEGLPAYVAANVAITAAVLEAIRRHPPRALFYASSGAARGAARLAEDPYGALKRLDELAFRQAMRDAGGRCVVARVFNVGGPFFVKEGFALISLVRQAQAGGPIEVRARHAVRRSYVDVEDLAALALAACEAGEDPMAGDDRPFDTAGEAAVEVGELAARVVRVLGRPGLEVRRELDPALPADDYVGDGARMHAIAAALDVPLRGLDEQIVRAAAWAAA